MGKTEIQPAHEDRVPKSWVQFSGVDIDLIKGGSFTMVGKSDECQIFTNGLKTKALKPRSSKEFNGSVAGKSTRNLRSPLSSKKRRERLEGSDIHN